MTSIKLPGIEARDNRIKRAEDKITNLEREIESQKRLLIEFKAREPQYMYALKIIYLLVEDGTLYYRKERDYWDAAQELVLHGTGKCPCTINEVYEELVADWSKFKNSLSDLGVDRIVLHSTPCWHLNYPLDGWAFRMTGWSPYYKGGHLTCTNERTVPIEKDGAYIEGDGAPYPNNGCGNEVKSRPFARGILSWRSDLKEERKES